MGGKHLDLLTPKKGSTKAKNELRKRKKIIEARFDTVLHNEPSKEEWGSGKRNRKLVTGICVYSTFIGRNLSRCKQTLGRQADRTYIQPIIYTDMCTLCTGLTVAQSPIFRTLS